MIKLSKILLCVISIIFILLFSLAVLTKIIIYAYNVNQEIGNFIMAISTFIIAATALIIVIIIVLKIFNK